MDKVEVKLRTVAFATNIILSLTMLKFFQTKKCLHLRDDPWTGLRRVGGVTIEAKTSRDILKYCDNMEVGASNVT